MGVERPTFPMVRFVEGYDTSEVDLAVAMVLENLALPTPRIGPRDVTRLRFTPTRLRDGYEMAAVDSWLDEVLAELERRGDGTTPEDTAADLGTMPAGDADPAGTAYAPATSTAITEVRSGGPAVTLVVLGIVVAIAVVAYALFA